MLSTEQLEAYHRYKNHKPSTRRRLRGALRHWSRLGLVDPTSDACESYRDQRLAEGASPATVRGEMNKLIGLARWLGFAPVVRLPHNIHRCPTAWDRRQLRRLFHAARTTRRTMWGVPGAIFWPALLGTCYDTGERIGAVLDLEWAAIDLAARRVVYVAEIRKGGYRDAVGTISRDTVRRLVALKKHKPGRLVFRHGCPSSLWRSYGRLLADAGLPHDRRSKFHRLRRTHATFVHLAGGDATAALGHASDAVTRASYIDWSQVRRRLPWRPWFMW